MTDTAADAARPAPQPARALPLQERIRETAALADAGDAVCVPEEELRAWADEIEALTMNTPAVADIERLKMEVRRLKKALNAASIAVDAVGSDIHKALSDEPLYPVSMRAD
jgi:hypothetical protein